MALFPETSETLIARVRDLGDEVSWTEFVELYRPAILRMAKRRGMQEADALDVIQHVFLCVAKSLDKWSAIDGGPPFRAWLATIARNSIINALTRCPPDAACGGSSVVTRLHSVAGPSSVEAAHLELLSETRHQLVLAAAEQIRDEFSHDVWQSFWMTAVENRPVSEVAAALERSPGSIYVARYRIVARLKEKVKELSHLWDN